MTASQPVADPLAPAPVVPAATSVAKSAGAAAKGSAPEQPPAKKKGSNILLLVLGGLLLVLLIAGGAVGLMFLPQAEPLPVASSTPVVPDPGNPPPPPQLTAAAMASAPPTDNVPKLTPEQVQAAGKRMAMRLLVGAGETSAPKEMIVRGGSAGDGAEASVPHHQRWEVSFPVGLTIESYAKQLDFFRIELGVIGGSPNVTFLGNLANAKPRTRSAPAATDPRIYLIWNRGPLREMDEILATRAGIDPANKVLAHFLPPETEAEMLRLEAAAAQTNKLTRIRKTVFGIQLVAGDTFRLTVLEQKGE